MKIYQAYINGEFVDSITKEVLQVRNPATERIISEVPACSGKDVQRCVEAAYIAQEKWRKVPPVKRGNYLKEIAKAIREKADVIAMAVTEEQGKTLRQSTGEVLEAADLIDYHAEWARRIEGEVLQSDSPDENIFLYKEPMGIVACILPWNFPIYVMIRKLAPALITGNTVILKPSSETPNSVLEFIKAIENIDLPKGVINVLTGKGDVVGCALASNPKVKFVTVTGSVEVGELIMKACARNITKVSLELGGKAPAIVMDDADIDLAVECISHSRISNAGQVCNCTERVYVHENIAEEFTAKIVKAMKEVTFGNGILKPDSMMGPMINRSSVERVDSMVNKAVSEGAKILTGGKLLDMEGTFYEPTVLINCTHDMDIMHQEIFGPVLPIMTIKSLDEGIKLANDCEYGLTSTLYTKNFDTALKVSNNIEFGELYINRKQGEAFQGYHAGWKKSGIGGDDGKHGVEEFMQTRVVYMKYK